MQIDYARDPLENLSQDGGESWFEIYVYDLNFLHIILISFTNFIILFQRYSILAVTFILTLLSFYIVSTRETAEAFASVWSALILISLSVGGTMVMRKFHNSFFTGLFIGGVVATAQYFFLSSLIFGGYARDREYAGLSGAGDVLQCIISFSQAVLLGSFALLLTAHRTEIMDRNSNLHTGDQSVNSVDFKEVEDDSSYDPPSFG